MIASTTTIANVTATLAPRAQSTMSSQIVTASSAPRAQELRRKAEKKGSALPVFGARRQRQIIDGYRSIGLDHGMPVPNAAAILEKILNEADALIRQRLKEKGIDLPHLVVGATPDDQIVVRTNGDADVMRSFGEDLKNVADELTAPPEPGDTTH